MLRHGADPISAPLSTGLCSRDRPRVMGAACFTGSALREPAGSERSRHVLGLIAGLMTQTQRAWLAQSLGPVGWCFAGHRM